MWSVQCRNRLWKQGKKAGETQIKFPARKFRNHEMIDFANISHFYGLFSVLFVNLSETSTSFTRKTTSSYPSTGWLWGETVWATVFPVAQTVKSVAQVVAPKVILRGSKAFLLSRSSGSFCQDYLAFSTYSRHGVQYRLKALRRNPCRREACLRYDMDVK